MKKINDYKSMKDEELQGEVKALKRELFNLKFNLAMNQLENPNKIKEVKKNIARVHTELTQRQIKAENNKVKEDVK